MHVCISVMKRAMKYVGTIRFGLFTETDIMTEDMSFPSMDDMYLLTTI